MRDFAQMVSIDEDTSLFLFGVNAKNEIVFRSTRNPSQLQNETYIISKGLCYLNLYFFHENYLKNLPNLI